MVLFLLFFQGLSLGDIICASSDLSDGYKQESILNSIYSPSPLSVPHKHTFEGSFCLELSLNNHSCIHSFAKHVRTSSVLMRQRRHPNTVEYFQYGGSWGMGWRTYREVHRLSILLSLFLVRSVANPDSSCADPKHSRLPLLLCKIISKLEHSLGI